MSAITTPLSETPEAWALPYRGTVGMACLIVAEASIFAIFVVAYLFYAGKSLSGPTPREVLETPVFGTICLLSSSLTIHFAAKFIHWGKRGAFLALWFLTIVLGGIFLIGTAQEWRTLIDERGLTISTNLFGTTYYSLVGLHASHVIVGLIMLSIVFLFGLAGRVGREHSSRVEVLALYWHFVDAVWVVVFTVVYVVAR
ncbi:MAG TPA: cytochrome c oxidase subunit 3 [Candidatus Angelobacter sp.]|nr:cytochrome c oxidase subunit 3 [Candidatus Angelobacter sp.]